MADDIEELADRVLKQSEALLVEAKANSKHKNPHPVSVVRRSSNRKLAPQKVIYRGAGEIQRIVPEGPYIVSTYVSIQATCPDSCAFKEKGCYAQAGLTAITVGLLDKRARGMTGLQVMKLEAAAIDKLWARGVPQDGGRNGNKGRDIRLHVAGEVSCRRGARVLGLASRRYKERGGGRIWTYTHRWRQIEETAWDPIHALASCDSEQDIRDAWAKGYVPSFVVERFPNGAHTFVRAGTRFVPCPAQVSGMTCVTCRLCMDTQMLKKRRLGIAFALHGRDQEEAKTRLRVLRDEPPHQKELKL